jgi:hypothetical protein
MSNASLAHTTFDQTKIGPIRPVNVRDLLFFFTNSIHPFVTTRSPAGIYCLIICLQKLLIITLVFPCRVCNAFAATRPTA